MIDTMPIGACLLGKEYEILLCNDTFCSETGFNKEQALAIKVSHVNRPPEMQTIKPQNIDENKQLQFSIVSSVFGDT